MIIGLDPGNIESALVVWDEDSLRIRAAVQQPNEFILSRLIGMRHEFYVAPLVIEQVASFGMPVGEEVFETVYWSGRFAQAFGVERVHRIKRLEVKLALCHDSRAKDGNIRQALIDRLGHPGTKKEPGILYGISKDLWSALAVAIAFQDKQRKAGA